MENMSNELLVADFVLILLAIIRVVAIILWYQHIISHELHEMKVIGISSIE